MVIDLTSLPDADVVDVLKPLSAWSVHLKDSATSPGAHTVADRVLAALDAEIAQRKANQAAERADKSNSTAAA